MPTTSATTGGARFIGRVGTLAVALGIGVAVANGTAIASAETSGSDSSGTHSKATGSTKTDSSTSRKGPRKPSLSDPQKLAKRVSDAAAKVESTLGSSKAGERRSSAASTDRKTDGTDSKTSKGTTRSTVVDAVENAADNVRQSVSRAITKAADTPRKLSAAPDNRPRAAVVEAAAPLETLTVVTKTVAKDVVDRVIPVPTRTQTPAAQSIPEIVAAATERLKPRLPETPVSPLQDLGLAALLGWSRRDGSQGLVPTGRVTTPEATPQVTPQLTSEVASEVSTQATSTLATGVQLAAEQQVGQIVNTPIVQLAKVVLMAAWYVEAAKNFATVGGPDFTNLSQLNQAATEFANQSATEFLLLNSNDPKLLLQVNPPHSWHGQDAGGTRLWYDNPDTVYRFTGINGASTYEIEGKIQGYDPADPSTHPTSANTNFSVLTGINGVTAANLNGEELSIRDDGTFTIVVSPNGAPANPERGMNYIHAPANSTILATRNTLGDWNTETPMKLTIEKVGGPPSSLFSQIGGFAIPVLGEAVVKNPLLMSLVSIVPAFDKAPLLLSSTETALLMLVTGINGENTYMSVATATGQPNTLSQPQHNAQFLSTQLQSAGYFQMEDDEAMVITVYPGDAEYFVVPVTNDWTITNDTRNQQTSLNNSQAIKNADGSYTIVVSKNDPDVANWVSTGGLNQGTISMRFQGVDPDATNNPTVTTRVVKLSEVEGIVTDASDPNYNPEQLNFDRDQQIAERQAGYDRRYTV